MKTSTALIIILSNQAHWFGGQTNTITAQWTAENAPAEAVLIWKLSVDGVSLAHGELKFGRKEAVLSLKPPQVRVRTTARWSYRVMPAGGGDEITHAEHDIALYPPDLVQELNKRLTNKRVVVWDVPSGLPKLLEKAKVSHERIDDDSKLQLAVADIVLVGSNQIPSGPFAQSSLVGQVQSGAGVMIFPQKRVSVLAGYALAERDAKTPLRWRAEHPLLARFQPSDLDSWLAQPTQELRAIHLPIDEPALELAYWAPESPGKQPVPIDALLVTKSVGRGRLVLCQIPLGPWQTDPRSQIFLTAALDYLTARPEPTPAPSKRVIATTITPASVPSIQIPSGDKP